LALTASCLSSLNAALEANGEGLLSVVLTVAVCSIVLRFYLARRERRKGIVDAATIELRRPWWRHAWAISCFSAAVLVCGFNFLIQANFRRLPLVRYTKQLIEKSDVVSSKLGSPVKMGWMISGSTTETWDDAGRADLRIPVSGGRSEGSVYISGTKGGGTWVADEMFLVVDGDSTKYSLIPTGPLNIGKPQY
jgi:hypothetical protein